MNSRHRNNHHNILSLMLTLPAHSADAERGFSEFKLVKSDWRTNLGNDVLTDLLHVLLHTPSIGEFDPTAAIHLWNASGPRTR
ncbi:hypothetical protein NP493_484g01000 [Ridgeia piscesae]|uniref:HAT C-terminal dimerisation domain-containing protein n=1 Tax=Ridgeia piscesae TaxID=27915 RepID=A0AAD9KZ83_RIDPI|nr:hypothetical protein NP493_484g01000 [Ridgeia piscesae]